MSVTILLTSTALSFPQVKRLYLLRYLTLSNIVNARFNDVCYLDHINRHNADYLAGDSTFYLNMNRFGDFTFDEFGKTNTDVGKFQKSENVTNKTVIPRYRYILKNMSIDAIWSALRYNHRTEIS